MECDQLLPGEPDPGGPHDVHPQLHPLLHLHERQVLHCPVTQEVVRSVQLTVQWPTKDAAVSCAV